MRDPSITVLLVEDNADDALLMQRAFKSQGLQRPPHVCTDALDAIDYLAGEGKYADRVTFPFPNLIITDLKMPRADGFELLQWLRQHPDLMVIPTIVWSSSDDPRDIKRAYCLGTNSYMRKPSDFQEFKTMVADMFRFWDHCQKPTIQSALRCDDFSATAPPS